MNITKESEDIGLFADIDRRFINTSCCVPAFVAEALEPRFWIKVIDLSERVFGITINSAYRSCSWEYSKGRSGSSQHCRGLAVDIACKDSEYRYNLVKNAIDLGFKRILIYPTFVHLDDKVDSPFKVVWMQK